mmetsp:Transcript_5168/g.12322  ORF Transcript_5168/g.12322 Transcript_5168/m.12322 type:complete len:234 (+) Transcript_5168:409-1110(+)
MPSGKVWWWWLQSIAASSSAGAGTGKILGIGRAADGLPNPAAPSPQLMSAPAMEASARPLGEAGEGGRRPPRERSPRFGVPAAAASGPPPKPLAARARASEASRGVARTSGLPSSRAAVRSTASSCANFSACLRPALRFEVRVGLIFAVEKATRSRAPRSGGTSRGARPNSRQATMNSCNFPAGPLRGCLKKLVRKMVSITTARSSVGTIFGELMLSIKETCIALEESQEETN